jgi:membrane dipeptidase
MIKKITNIMLVLLASLIVFAGTISEDNMPDKALMKKAMRIHDEAIVVDTHVDTPMVMFERGVDIGQRTENSDVDLIKMKEGGLDAVFFAVFTPNSLDDKNPSKVALSIIDTIYSQVEKYYDLAEIAYTPDDLERINKTGKRAIFIGMENGGPIEDSLALLRTFYRLGVRYITLTHNENNNICDSSTADAPKWNGLSPFGIDVVKEMNRLGMMVDVSHISDKAFWDVIKYSKAPVIASHSCVRSICDTNRNMSDEMIKALAEKGGVIQINFYGGFLSKEIDLKSKEIRKQLAPIRQQLREQFKDDEKEVMKRIMAEYKRLAPPSPPIDLLIDHIDYAVKLVGVDHVGLGSDFDGASSYPVGLEDASKYPIITYKLLERGYSEKDIKKILGGNLLRVFNKVIETAEDMND